MSSTPQTQLSDLTAVARIRDAALRLFGEKGVAATSIREVAAAAGVSPGLVQYHFRSKRALEAAVSANVTARMAELIRSELTPGITAATLSLGTAIVGFIRGNSELVAYVRRVILEDDRFGHGLFDSIVELSRKLNRRLLEEGLLRPDLDPIWTPLLTMMLVLGPLLLEPALNRYLNHPLRTEEGLARWNAAVEDLYLRGIYRNRHRATGPKSKIGADQLRSRRRKRSAR